MPRRRGYAYAALGLLLLLSPSAAALEIPVRDLCAKRDVDRDRSQKQRLFLFNLSGLARVERGERLINQKGKKIGSRQVLKEIGGAQIFGEIWLKTFPMRRFEHLMTPNGAPAA
ncbi:hypothetical protein KKB55_22485, partial [Myxococcota bacterium]|nr:hypothetical protein [Myxococcota bacterium]